MFFKTRVLEEKFLLFAIGKREKFWGRKIPGPAMR